MHRKRARAPPRAGGPTARKRAVGPPARGGPRARFWCILRTFGGNFFTKKTLVGAMRPPHPMSAKPHPKWPARGRKPPHQIPSEKSLASPSPVAAIKFSHSKAHPSQRSCELFISFFFPIRLGHVRSFTPILVLDVRV